MEALRARLLRMLPIRFTVRRLMTVVVITALLLGSQVIIQPQRRFQERFQFEHNWNEERRFQALAWFWGMQYGRLGQVSNLGSPERRQYHRDLEAKYERAARYPWLSVEVDPPEPE
jgi:hypothetical protein